ncbi:HdeD family acid-resistance protein [Herbaspirillum rhizosphaerae]|uniref:HdeD family acid-resistance protein n=1 Tax=Herbaspirillum rhizosphaerae TaxID=346179 RepID=UPI0009FAF05D|nr:MFS transporter [Herbaspirillum rhizosphaerae]
MIRLVLLLLGADFIRRYWPVLALIGLAWGVIGVSLCIDALDGVLVFPLTLFGYLLLLESLATLFLASSGIGAQKSLRYLKGGLFLLISLLVISLHPTGDMVLAMLFGAAFTIGGGLQIASALVVRFPSWRMALAGGVGQILIAIFFFQPYPTHYKGTLPYCIGMGLIFSGWNLIWLASRTRRLPRTASISQLSLRNADSDRPLDAGSHDGQAPAAGGVADVAGAVPMTVHVWTPVGSAKEQTLNRPIVNRYIAAVDASGTVSTGHAALEIAPSLYISLYPAEEIDRSPDQFARLLRATPDNNVRGRYLSDYPSEAASWCPSTERISFRDYDLQRLQQFWLQYRQEEIYNLTHRNCSSTVAHALEAALEGVIGRRAGHWLAFVKILFTPEVWVASQIHKRAATMAWTPGLTLDYARALRAVVHPRPLSWVGSLQLAIRRSRRLRRDDAVRRMAGGEAGRNAAQEKGDRR